MLTTVRATWLAALSPDGKIDIDRARDAHVLAKDAAPYVHPRLQQIEGNPDKPLLPDRPAGSFIDRVRRFAFMLRQAREVQGEVINKTVSNS